MRKTTRRLLSSTATLPIVFGLALAVPAMTGAAVDEITSIMRIDVARQVAGTARALAKHAA